MKPNLFLIYTIFCLTGCSAQLKKGIFSVEEGISGQVIWKQGNYMPSSDIIRKKKGKGIEREIVVFKLVNKSQAISENGFFKINKKPLAITRSTENGFFEIKLPPGKYSVFTKEEKGLFANSFDGDGNINPVEVTSGQATRLLIMVDYKAAY